jgi:hypothetical protein
MMEEKDNILKAAMTHVHVLHKPMRHSAIPSSSWGAVLLTF